MSALLQRKRLPKDLSQIQQNYHQHGIRCNIVDDTPDDCIYVEAKIPGPKSSPYEGGIFTVRITISEDYPFRPANFKFVSPIYHPNIDKNGLICLDLLRSPPSGTYTPAITLENILLSIQLLLANPNADDALNIEAAKLYKENIHLFNEEAKKIVIAHCMQQQSNDDNDTTENMSSLQLNPSDNN